MLPSEKSIDSYCDQVFRELEDIKLKIAGLRERAETFPVEDKKSISDNIFILLDELSESIDSKLNSIITYCPSLKEKTKGASRWAAQYHQDGE